MKIDSSVYISNDAVVLGNVEIGKNSSIWPNATIRADSYVKIGEKTNIQDNCVLHSKGNEETLISDEVTVGHSAVVHGAKINKNCLIGMNSNVLTDAEIGKNSIVAAASLVTEEKTIPPNSVVMGVPGKVVRETTEKEKKMIKERAKEYYELSKEYKE